MVDGKVSKRRKYQKRVDAQDSSISVPPPLSQPEASGWATGNQNVRGLVHAEDSLASVSPALSQPEYYEVNDPMRYGIILSASNRERWERLFDLRMVSSRYACDTTMRELGIYDDVWKLVDRIGWGTMMRGRWYTYRIPTLEVLSTLDVQGNPPRVISFRLNNQSRSLSLEEINSIFQLPSDGAKGFMAEVNKNEFWRSLVSTDPNSVEIFNPYHSKSSQIRNINFLYIQKMISNSVLAQKETGYMRAEELFILWSMLSGQHVDIGAKFIENLLKQSMLYSGVISIGGMITPIARYFKVDLSQYPPESSDIYLNFNALVRMKILDGYFRNPYKLKQSDGDVFPLPNVELTAVDTLENQTNWSMSTERHREAARVFVDPVVTRNVARMNDRENEEDAHVHQEPMKKNILESSAAVVPRNVARMNERENEEDSHVHQEPMKENILEYCAAVVPRNVARMNERENEEDTHARQEPMQQNIPEFSDAVKRKRMATWEDLQATNDRVDQLNERMNEMTREIGSIRDEFRDWRSTQGQRMLDLLEAMNGWHVNAGHWPNPPYPQPPPPQDWRSTQGQRMLDLLEAMNRWHVNAGHWPNPPYPRPPPPQRGV